MTHFLNHYTLKFTPLTPLHIGADESYEPGNYVIDDEAGALYSYDTQAVLAGLTDSDRKQLLSIVSGKPDDEMITKVQDFFHSHREKLLAFANQPVPVTKGLLRHYLNRIGKTANRESNGRRVINKLEIDRCFYNPVTGHPVLPGSSIKGAIRTAMLDAENQGKSTNHRKHGDLQKELLHGSFDTDPFRLISLGDANWQGVNSKPVCEVKFAINCKREPVVKDGKLLESQAEIKGLYQLLECIAPNHYQGFSGSINFLDTQSIKQHASKLPKQNLLWTIKDVAEKCNAFYMHLFINEIAAMKKRNYLETDWTQKIESLLADGLLKRLDANEAFLLRLGRHSGAEALTLDGVRKIKIMQGRDKPPINNAKKPITWWLAADDVGSKQGMLPFGWVLVEIDPQTPDTQLQNWLENGNAELSQWMQTQLAKQNQLKKQAEMRQSQELARLLIEQEQAEAARLKSEAEKQRLESLSPLEQEIETLLKSIPQQEHDTRLLQELEKDRWQGDDSRIVALKIKTLMEQSGKWLPGFTGENKQKAKLKERSQKVLKFL